MRIEIFGDTHIWVHRDGGDKPIRKETTFYRHVCRTLNEMGLPYVVACPSKDGCLFGDEYTRWLRPAGSRQGPSFYDDRYMIERADKAYRENGSKRLDIVTD